MLPLFSISIVAHGQAFVCTAMAAHAMHLLVCDKPMNHSRAYTRIDCKSSKHHPEQTKHM